MRVTSEFWVSALVRKVQTEGAFATVVRKGAAEAGAIFLIVNNLSNEFSLYTPAPQALYSGESDGERAFELRLNSVSEEEVLALIHREASFDPDIWVVEIEDQQARVFFA